MKRRLGTALLFLKANKALVFQKLLVSWFLYLYTAGQPELGSPRTLCSVEPFYASPRTARTQVS